MTSLDSATEQKESRQTAVGRIQRILEGAARLLTRDQLVLVALLLSAYAAVTEAYANRPFWYDELYTVYLCRFPSVSRIWDALKAGADFITPLLYIVTRPFLELFGEHPFVLRIPAMLGFLVLCFCLYAFVSRRCGSLYGIAAALIPLLTLAYRYASEARPYGIVLGFSGLALISWQRIIEQKYGRIWVVVFALSLSGAIQSHAYAVLLLVPFGCAEVIRTLQRRRVDIAIWICLLVAASSTAIYLPLMGNAREYKVLAGYAFGPRLSSVPAAYWDIFEGSMWPVSVVLAMALARAGTGHRAENTRATAPTNFIPIWENACLAGFLLTPILSVALAAFLHGGYMPRYALISVIGFSSLIPMFIHRTTSNDQVSAAFVVYIVFGSWLLMYYLIPLFPFSSEPMAKLQPIKFSQFDDTLPIVISNGLTFLETDYRESPNIATRLVYLTDSDTAVAMTGVNIFDHAFYRLREWFPIRGKIIDYHQFLQLHRKFFVYGPYEYPEDWTIEKLLHDGVHLTLKGRFTGERGDSVLLLAETKQGDRKTQGGE